jgi:putative ABC transport system permease protein
VLSLGYGWILLEAWRQAWQSCLAHPLRSILGALAIAVAVATEVLVVTAVDGVATYARVTAARTFGSDTFLLANVAAPGQISRRELAAKLERNSPIRRPDVRFLERYASGKVVYAPSAQRVAEVTAGARTFENALVSGTSATLADIRDLGIERGRFFRAHEESRASQVVLIGADIADALFPALDPLNRKIRLGGRGFLVIGIQARQGTVAGASLDRYVWLPLPTFERVFGAAETLQVFARAPEPDQILEAEDHARISLRARRHLQPDAADNFDILSPEAARGFVLRLSERVGAAAGPISFMAMLAAIVVVTNTTLASVTQRTREIGVRRAVGANRRHVMTEVLAESSLMALIGGVVGMLSALILVTLLSRVFAFDLRIGLSTAFWSLATAGLAGVVAGWYPARRASRIDVIAAVRLE